MKEIAVFVDGSKHSRRALQMAKDVAEKFGSKLYIINVQQTVFPHMTYKPYNILPGNYEKILKENGEAILNKAKTYLEDSNIEISTILLKGEDIAETIINYLDKRNLDLVVMGSRGLSGATRFLLGSVSLRVMTYAKIPVLIVK